MFIITDQKINNFVPIIRRLQHPNKAASTLEADYHQRITMVYQLKDRSSNAMMLAHQSFVRLTNQKTKQEIFFVPEADASSNYKFDLVSLIPAWETADYSQFLIIWKTYYPLFFLVISHRAVGPGTGDIATPLSVCPSVTFSFRTVTRKRIDVFSRNFAGMCTMLWGCAV